MRKYFWRQLSARWFDRYLTFCGFILNAIALVSVGAAVLPHPKEREERRYLRALVELENGPRCDQMMANSEFAPGKEFELQLADKSRLKVSYKDQGTNQRTKDGHEIHMVEMERVGFLFFEVDDKKIIRRCVPSAMLECVTANGSFDKDGECIVAVNLPSDCTLMKGIPQGDRCRVPPGTRILKPTSRAGGNGKICISPGCKTE